jgi:SPP1 gp7 family putative phage head morphogenesis protein
MYEGHQDARTVGSQALDEVHLVWAAETQSRKKQVADSADRAAKKVIARPSPLTKLVPVNRRTLGFGPTIDRFREQNVRLIENVGEDFLKGLREELESADAAGARVEDIADKIEKRFDVSSSRAELIARDQVLTLNAQVAQTRQQLAGIEKYVWTTSNDERVREEHAALDGQVFSWDAPPDVGHPGDDILCRCIAFPIIEGVDETQE